jgi:hypothetical protein
MVAVVNDYISFQNPKWTQFLPHKNPNKKPRRSSSLRRGINCSLSSLFFPARNRPPTHCVTDHKSQRHAHHNKPNCSECISIKHYLRVLVLVFLVTFFVAVFFLAARAAFMPLIVYGYFLPFTVGIICSY